MSSATPSAKRPTSWDVARHAGVSRSTVNEILNGRTTRFPAATLERVQHAVTALGYTPSPAARSLKIGRSEIVLLLIPGGTLAPTFTELIDELSAAALSLRLHVVVQFTRGSARHAVADVARLAPLVVINLGALEQDDAAALRASGVSVLPDENSAGPLDFEQQVAEVMVSALLARGVTRCVYVEAGDERHYPPNRERYEGVCAAVVAAELAAPPIWQVPFSVDAIASRLIEIVPGSDSSGPVGLACSSDTVALAALAACRASGIAVPAQVAIVGVDATAEGMFAVPALTSVLIDHAAIGRHLADDVRRVLGESGESTSSTAAAVRLLPGGTC